MAFSSTPKTTSLEALSGAANLARFNVWSDQVYYTVVKLGDLVDRAKRLDGTTELRFPQQRDCGRA